MAKRNVAFIKPSEPAFLRRLKEQVGYKEGPTVDTKKRSLPSCESSDESDGEDQPQIVVLKPGDLTKEEADSVKKESETAKADLDQRIVFKRPEKSSQARLEKPKKRPTKEAPQQVPSSATNRMKISRIFKCTHFLEQWAANTLLCCNC